MTTDVRLSPVTKEHSEAEGARNLPPPPPGVGAQTQKVNIEVNIGPR